MKTKQSRLRAEFATERDNAINYGGAKPLVARHILIDKKTEKIIVDCRVYGSGHTVYCALWVMGIKPAKVPAGWSHGSTSGRGKASGYGADKESIAADAAIQNAGIKLWGSHYGAAGFDMPRDILKKPASIAGCGDKAVESALLAIAYAAGYTDCIYV